MSHRIVSEDERNRHRMLASFLHHSQSKSNTEIARLLGVSTTQVKRLLDDAIALEIVRVQYTPPQIQHSLEIKLVEKFNLQEAIVIPTVKEMSVMRQLLAHKAAEYFENSTKGHKRVAIGGGITLYQMVNELPIRERNIKILPSAIVGRGPTLYHIDPLTLVSLLWIKSGHKPDQAYSVTVPPMEAGTSMRQAKIESEGFLTRTKVRAVFEEMKKVDSVFVSIGSIVDEGYDQQSHGIINLLREIDMSGDQLRESQIVGDINYSYFDAKGETRDEWGFLLTLGVKELKKMVKDGKKVVVVVGNYKIKALKAILKGKLCSVLITDDEAAETLLGPE